MKTENQTKNQNKMDNQRELYHAPVMEIIEVKVEKGFAASELGSGGSSTGNWGNGGAW